MSYDYLKTDVERLAESNNSEIATLAQAILRLMDNEHEQ